MPTSSKNYNLILNGRRVERLQILQQNLKDKQNADSFLLPFDVQEQQAVFDSINGLTNEWKNIDVLINNAGLALGRDLFDEADLKDWYTMIDTNVKGLLYVSKAILPLMIKNKKGHIINLGSVAGKEIYEKGNVYCASKFCCGCFN